MHPQGWAVGPGPAAHIIFRGEHFLLAIHPSVLGPNARPCAKYQGDGGSQIQPWALPSSSW